MMDFGFMLDPATIIAITGLVSVLGNIYLTIDTRRRAKVIEEKISTVAAIVSNGKETHK